MWIPKHRFTTAVAMTLLAFAAIAARAGGGREDLGWSAVIAPPDEPGERLRVTGTVFAPDGETPVAGALLYVYHTDVRGFYSGTTTSPSDPRLEAHLRTGADGRYEVRTIKPGAYPDGGPPAHIHYVISGAGYPEQRHDLHFEGDPRITESHAERSRQQGRFGDVRPLERDEEGVLHCVRDIRLHD